MAAGSFGVKHVTEDGQRFLHDGRKVHDGRHGGSLLTALKALGRQRGILHYTPSSLLCKTSVSKTKAKVDLWLKAIAPSTPLRQWFGHDPGKWHEFKKRYKDELNHNSEAVAQLRALMDKGTVTLVYGAKDQEHNDAVVLQEYLVLRFRISVLVW